MEKIQPLEPWTDDQSEKAYQWQSGEVLGLVLMGCVNGLK